MLLLFRPRFRASNITRCYASTSRPNPQKSSPRSIPNPKPTSKSTSKPKPETTPTINCEEYRTFTLPDSRKLGYSEYGPSNGPVILFFHGFPGSRFDARCIANTHTRVIGIDRPGIGLSTFHKNRRLVDWPKDVEHLVQHLGIKQFRVLGVSGGGPYAIACANAFSKDVLRATGVVAGSAPLRVIVDGTLPERLMKGWSSWIRVFLRVRSWWSVGRKINSRSLPVQTKTLRHMAREMGHKGEFDMSMINALKEPFKQGVNGYVEDVLVLYSHWGFELEDVKAKNILLWYGEEDTNTPLHWGEYMAERMEGAELKAFPGETHFTVLANREEQILQELMEAGK